MTEALLDRPLEHADTVPPLEVEHDDRGFVRRYIFSTDHKVIGIQYILTGLVMALAGAWDARMNICRTFWHYLGGVWVFLFALMSVY